jgi:Gram-negative bacterial TonB protein C-terminal
MTKKTPMHSVAQVLSPDFGRTWHEAVAIVQEVASQLAPGISMPAPEDLLFDESGALVFGFGSESRENPVVSLSFLLKRLLDGVDAPSGLVELANENSRPSPAHATVEGFSRALAFYERPNRSTDVQAVASRLRAGGMLNPDAEFERLREKVAGTAESSEKKKEPQKGLVTGRHKKAIAVAAVGVAAFVAVLAVTRAAPRESPAGSSASQPPAPATPGVIKRAQDKMSETLSAGLNKIGLSGTTTAAAPVHAEAPLPESRPISTSGRRAARDVVLDKARPKTPSIPPVAPVPPSDRPTAAAPPLAADAMPVPTEPAAPDPRNGGESVVYSSADRAVQPPTFWRPQLPREPAPGSDTGYFDIIVNENGDVEQVKLVSPKHRYQERMLVAAAKAWKFRPAVLNGQNVKYRMRVPIIVAGLP